jgi:hypothetical protein
MRTFDKSDIVVPSPENAGNAIMNLTKWSNAAILPKAPKIMAPQQPNFSGQYHLRRDRRLGCFGDAL